MKDKIRKSIEDALVKLMNPKAVLTAEEKDELRKNCLLAIKWEAVKNKTNSQDWGKGFSSDDDDEEKELQ